MFMIAHVRISFTVELWPEFALQSTKKLYHVKLSDPQQNLFCFAAWIKGKTEKRTKLKAEKF